MSEQKLVEGNPALPYATPTPGRRMSSAAVLMFGGIALVFLGGCFLIGVMMNVMVGGFSSPAPTGLTAGQIVFVATLYGAAFGCFGGAIYLILLSIRYIRHDSI